MDVRFIKSQFDKDGFFCIDTVYTSEEIAQLIKAIEKANQSNATFRKITDIFAIRQFLKEIPEAASLIFNSNLKQIIYSIFGEEYFVVKSIYFDKPGTSNWFVAYHQDLTISVKDKTQTEGFGPWTVKQNQFAVQPPQQILQKNFTIRIHLDETTADNGALKVIAGSHHKGIVQTKNLDVSTYKQTTCAVQSGGIMLMHPLLFHSSERTTYNQRRRVIHIEFSNTILPEGLQWAEKLVYN